MAKALKLIGQTTTPTYIKYLRLVASPKVMQNVAHATNTGRKVALSAVTFGATLGCLALYISEYRPVMEAIPIYGRKYKEEPIEPID